MLRTIDWKQKQDNFRQDLSLFFIISLGMTIGLFIPLLDLAVRRILIIFSSVFFISFLLRLLRFPFAGTQMIFLTLPITIPIIGNIFGGKAFFNIRIWQIFSLLTFSVLLVHIFLFRRKVVKTPLGLVFLIYLSFNILSFYNSPYLVDSVRQIIKLIFVNAILYFVIVNTVKRREDFQRVINILFIGGIIVASLGLAQMVAYFYFGINWFIIPDNPKPTGTFTETGWYSIYLSFIFALALPLYFSSAFRRYKKLLGGALFIYLIGIILGSNRGAWVSTFLTLILALFVLGNRARKRLIFKREFMLKIILIPVLSLLIGYVFLPQVVTKLKERLNVSDRSAMERVNRLKLEFERISQHPIIGNGIGTWGQSISEELFLYLDAETISPVVLEGGIVKRGGSSFNIFVGALFDAGILGLFGLLMLVFIYTRTITKGIRNARTEWDKAVLQSSFLGFICLLINSQFNPAYMWGFAWAGVALGMAAYTITSSSETEKS